VDHRLGHHLRGEGEEKASLQLMPPSK